MKEKRYYYDGKLVVGQSVILDNEEAHHLINVMRTRVGESVCLFNGNGNFYFGNVQEIAKKSVKIKIEREEQSQSEPKVQVDVFQALAKGDKLSLIMQKITELGANKLFLFESKFCDVKANSNKQERLDSISISASKQCGRATLVECAGIITLAEISGMIKDYDAFYLAYENEDGHTLFEDLLHRQNDLKKVAIMVGAEGGFAEEEIQMLKNAGANVVSLGRRILRTETATIACTALLTQILDK